MGDLVTLPSHELPAPIELGYRVAVCALAYDTQRRRVYDVANPELLEYVDADRVCNLEAGHVGQHCDHQAPCRPGH